MTSTSCFLTYIYVNSFMVNSLLTNLVDVQNNFAKKPSDFKNIVNEKRTESNLMHYFYYFNGRSIKKVKLNSVIIISVLTNLMTFVKEF